MMGNEMTEKRVITQLYERRKDVDSSVDIMVSELLRLDVSFDRKLKMAIKLRNEVRCSVGYLYAGIIKTLKAHNIVDSRTNIDDIEG